MKNLCGYLLVFMMLALPAKANEIDCEKAWGDESIQIEFTFWNEKLEKSQEDKLKEAAVRSFKHEFVCVVGIIGDEGDFEKYKEMSGKQTKAVSKYLLSQGVAKNRIIPVVDRSALSAWRFLRKPTRPNQNKQIVEIRYFE